MLALLALITIVLGAGWASIQSTTLRLALLGFNYHGAGRWVGVAGHLSSFDLSFACPRYHGAAFRVAVPVNFGFEIVAMTGVCGTWQARSNSLPRHTEGTLTSRGSCILLTPMRTLPLWNVGEAVTNPTPL